MGQEGRGRGSSQPDAMGREVLMICSLGVLFYAVDFECVTSGQCWLSASDIYAIRAGLSWAMRDCTGAVRRYDGSG